MPVTGLLPLLFALTIIETAAQAGRAPASSLWLAVVIGGGALWWWLVSETVARLLMHRSADGHRQRRWAERWEWVAQALALAGFAALCHGMGYTAVTFRSYSVAIAPWVALQVILWWTSAGIGRGRTPSLIERWHTVLHHLRFALLPLLLALPLLDLCALIANQTHLDRWLYGHLGELMNVLGSILLAMTLVAVMPWLLVRMWGAKPLPPGPVFDELTADCQRARVRVGGIRSWPSAGHRQYNALVVGVLPQLRYVLFTTDLLRDFPRDERTAVLGHELGHARHAHLWTYLLFAAATGLLSWTAHGVVDAPLTAALSAHGIAAATVSAVVALVLLAVQWRLLFGVLSRLCERQADVAGAELAGEGDLARGCQAMQRALLAVARHGEIDLEAPSWRHHSIAQRVRFLDAVIADGQVATRHHRRVRRTVRMLAALTGGLAGWAVATVAPTAGLLRHVLPAWLGGAP